MTIAMMATVSVMTAVAAVVPTAAEGRPNTQGEMALLHEWTGRGTWAISHVRAAVEGLRGADGWREQHGRRPDKQHKFHAAVPFSKSPFRTRHKRSMSRVVAWTPTAVDQKKCRCRKCLQPE